MPEKIIFVSYSKKSGEEYFQYVKKRLEKIGFSVTTGFEHHADDRGNVLKRVLGQLKRSSVYLGVLTKDLQVTVPEGIRWAPGVWTVEEKGMALAMNKPFVLMVQDGIHKDYWQKTAGERVHHMFNSTNYLTIAEGVVEDVSDRYTELAEQFLDRGE